MKSSPRQSTNEPATEEERSTLRMARHSAAWFVGSAASPVVGGIAEGLCYDLMGVEAPQAVSGYLGFLVMPAIWVLFMGIWHVLVYKASDSLGSLVGFCFSHIVMPSMVFFGLVLLMTYLSVP